MLGDKKECGAESSRGRGEQKGCVLRLRLQHSFLTFLFSGSWENRRGAQAEQSQWDISLGWEERMGCTGRPPQAVPCWPHHQTPYFNPTSTYLIAYKCSRPSSLWIWDPCLRIIQGVIFRCNSRLPESSPEQLGGVCVCVCVFVEISVFNRFSE